jgi:hypothetical protein
MEQHANDTAVLSAQAVTACNKGLTSMLAVARLGDMINLTSLNLHMNNISRIENLKNLRLLKSLDISANDISVIEGISHLSELVSLNLSSNRIAAPTGLRGLKKLQRLSIAFNLLSSLEGLEDLASLTYLDVAGNRLEKVAELRCLASLRNLKELRLAVPQAAGATAVAENPLVDREGRYVAAVHAELPGVATIDTSNVMFDPLSDERACLRAQPFLAFQAASCPLGKVDEYLRGMGSMQAVAAKPRMKKVTRGTNTEHEAPHALPDPGCKAAPPVPEPTPEGPELAALRASLATSRAENLRLAAALEASNAAAQQEMMQHEAHMAEMVAEHTKIVNHMQRENTKSSQQLILLEADMAQVRAESAKATQESSRRITLLEKEKVALEKRLDHATDESKGLLRELRASEKKAAVALATFEQAMRTEMDSRLAHDQAEVERRLRADCDQRLLHAERQYQAAVASTVSHLESRSSAALAEIEARCTQLQRERDAFQSSADRLIHRQFSGVEQLEQAERRSVAFLRDGELRSMLTTCFMEAKALRADLAARAAIEKSRKPEMRNAAVMCEGLLMHNTSCQTTPDPCPQCLHARQCISRLEEQRLELCDEVGRGAAALRSAQQENADINSQLQEARSERENMLRTIRNLKESLAQSDRSMQELEDEAAAKIESKRDELRQLFSENERLKVQCAALAEDLAQRRLITDAPAVRADDTVVENLKRAVEALRSQLVSVHAAYCAVSAERSAVANQCKSLEAVQRQKDAEYEQTLQEQRAAWEKKLQSIVSQALNKS